MALGLALSSGPVLARTPVFINELHYDNSGADTGEAIEIAGPAGFDLSGWTLVLYNGANGSLYDSRALTAVLPDSCGGLGVAVETISGIQNGSPDGIALVDAAGQVVQFLSYEGDFTAVDGPADGLSSQDIGAGEAGSTPVGQSLQLTGSGRHYEDFAWAAARPATFGQCNTGQQGSGDGSTRRDPVINEFVFNHTGSDSHEYVEVLGDADTDYNGFTLLVVEGDSDDRPGLIKQVLPLGTTDGDGFRTTGFLGGLLENGSQTLLLVADNRAAAGQDLDADNDGGLDAQPWSRQVDAVAVSDGGSDDRFYGAPVLSPGYDGVDFSVAGASRIPDGSDTDAAGDWVRNDFDGGGLPGFPGSPRNGEALNTPGASNRVFVTLPDILINEVDADTPGADTAEFLELYDGGHDPMLGRCGDPATPIHDIQGSGDTSPLAGQGVVVEAVVVGDFQAESRLGGFFLQEEDAQTDGDPATSEGLFVFDNGAGLDVQTGDVVRVAGEVKEFFGLTELSRSALPVICAGGGEVTPAVLNLPLAPADREALEGMRVTLPQTLTVAENFNLGRAGEVVLATERLYQPTHLAQPGAAARQVAEDNAARRLVLDDGSLDQNPVPIPYPPPGLDAHHTLRIGDTTRGVQGVLSYSWSGFDSDNTTAYRIHPLAPPDFTAANPRPAAPDLPGVGSLTVASFNVLNYFNGPDFPTARGADTPEEFQRQRDKIISAMLGLDADIIGLMELENDGFGPDSAIADLVAGLNAALGADIYAYTDPGVARIGEDDIAVGLIYRSAAVTPLGGAAILDSSVDADFIDGKNRPVLAQSFRRRGRDSVLTVAVNHFKSKGSPCDDIGDPDLGDGQGNCNRTRTQAAQALVDWLATDPTGSGDPDRLIIGDLNSYAQEDPIAAIRAAGYTDLIRQNQGQSGYSYVFRGESGYLDYALASGSLVSQVTGVAQWPINTDEPRVLDYNVEFKTPEQVADLYAPGPYRASDHDPVIVELALTAVSSSPGGWW